MRRLKTPRRRTSPVRAEFSVAVDAGASSLRAAAVTQSPNGRLKIVRRARLAFSRSSVADSTRVIAGPLKRLLRKWQVRADILTVGSTGIWGSEAKSSLKRSLRGIAPIIRTMSDVELAWDARLAERGSGVLLIAGTGAIAMARRNGGPAVRSGGLGPLLGDEGSAFWIGREWLKSRPEREALALVRRPDVVRRVARLARRAPSALIDRAAAHLITLAERAAAGAGLRSPVPLACHGGLFHDPRLHAAVAKRLRRSKLRWKLVPAVGAPEIVAARLALAHRKFIVE